MSGSRWTPNWVVLVAVGVVLVAAVVALFVTTRGVRTYDRSTPQGVVQAYVTAVSDGDHAAATAFFAPGSPCKVADLDRTGVSDPARVDLVSTSTDGDAAQVTIDVSYGAGGPFGDVSSQQFVLRLARTGADWRLTGVPWPLYDCAGVTS